MSDAIRFGTDGWRAVIGQDFTDDNVRRVADALGAIWESQSPGGVVVIGYDTREGAERFARLLAGTLAARNLRVVLSDRYVPTPALCWSVAHHDDAIGGVMLTASHNPAQYLGVKVRMADGGAAPVEFTRRIEAAIEASAEAPAPPAQPAPGGMYLVQDIISPYLDALRGAVNAWGIRNVNSLASIRIVVDPLHGAGRGYLAQLLQEMGFNVLEVHGEADPTFGGLHPEPIPPWTDGARSAMRGHYATAAFVTDGDADRIGALDETGAFVSPHRIIALIAMHLVESKLMTGRIVKTLSTSVTVDRLGRHLGCAVTTTPIGFKWIYEEMLRGDVLIGGEESGGIGIPGHVLERDGLLMALLLAEMIATQGKSLKTLVDELVAIVGDMRYRRVDLALDAPVKDRFVASIPTADLTELAGRPVLGTVRDDGLKLLFPDDEWLLMRPSGTEPLVRVYAEANSEDGLEALLSAGVAFVQNS